MLKVNVKGDYSETKEFLEELKDGEYLSNLEQFGEMGVEALAAVTPVRTGLTAASWGYNINQKENGNVEIVWTNSNVYKGKNIAILLDSGHGTRSGYYISGRNYINPALDPVLEQLINSIKEEVSEL